MALGTCESAAGHKHLLAPGPSGVPATADGATAQFLLLRRLRLKLYAPQPQGDRLPEAR